MVERRNLFINQYYKIAFILIIFIIPLILSFSAKFISRILVDINFFNVSKLLGNQFLENILEIFGIMVFSFIIIVMVFLWSKKQYDFILNKIKIPCYHLIKGNKPLQLSFRKSDLFISFGPTFNEFVDIFYKRKQQADLLLNTLKLKIEQLRENPSKDDIALLLSLFK